MEKQLSIEIGGEVFHISSENGDHRLIKPIWKKWSEYVSYSTKKGCMVRLSPYFHDRKYNWHQSSLDKFKKYFLMIDRRSPSRGAEEERVETSVKLLEHLNPEGKWVRYISSRIDGSETIDYTRVGFDLYFFDPKSNTAIFFIRERGRHSPWMVRILSDFRLRGSYGATGMMNGIMFALSHCLIHSGGLLVHGAALQKDNRTALFLGFSGGGKSTITRLCNPDVCFSDDGAVIKKEGNHIYAYRSPFKQIKKKDKKIGILKGEITKIFLLEKGRETKVLPIKKHELMNTILTHLIHFFKYLDKETASLGFCVLKEILDTVPVYRLQFTKENKICYNIWQ